MINDKDTQAMFRIVNENADYHKIAEYIITRFNVDLDMQYAKKMAENLVKNEGFSKEEIFQGLADESIANRLNFRKKYTKSVRQKDEVVTEILLKTIKEKINAKFVAGALATIMLLSATYGFVIKPSVEEFKENREITQSIGMLVAEPGSDAYEHKQSIVSQNTYQVPGQFNEQGHPVIAYYNDKIAEDIIKVCTKDPELFDLCMYNVYFDMSYNRLSNMDSVVRYLQIYSASEESLSFIQNKLDNCSVFLDYLISRGFADPNNEDYYELLEDINKYEVLKGNSDVPFNALPKESQERIERLIEEFKSNKNNLYSEYKDNLENVEGDNYGTRS